MPVLEDEAKYSALYTVQVPLFVAAYEKRAEALHQSGEYRTETYTMSGDVLVLLQENDISPDMLFTCYGNQYQQCLHQESLIILEHTSQIPISSRLYQHKPTIATFVEVACEYNHAGECHKSVPLLDFCWTLLSWATQIVEGAAEGAVSGVIGAVTDIIEHPVETGMSVVLGSSVMLTYQLSKIVYTVTDLSITRLVDPVAGKQKWYSYLEPLNAVIDAIDTKQIGLKNVSKAVTQFGVQWYTQAKLLGGLRNLYDGIKTKAVASINSGVTAGLGSYLVTPDDTLMKVATDALDPARSNGIPFLQRITADGRIACEVAFPISDVIRNVFTQSSNLLILPCNTKQLESGLTGIATLLNAQLKKKNGRESMAALLARLQKEAEACGSPSPSGPKKDDDEKDRYKGPKYSNMDELAEKESFGKRLLNNIEKIKGAEYKGRQGYRVINDMPDLGIKSGDKLYLDSFHGDHIEVFKAGPKGSLPRQVISVDGRILVEKLNKAKADKRKCPF